MLGGPVEAFDDPLGVDREDGVGGCFDNAAIAFLRDAQRGLGRAAIGAVPEADDEAANRGIVELVLAPAIEPAIGAVGATQPQTQFDGRGFAVGLRNEAEEPSHDIRMVVGMDEVEGGNTDEIVRIDVERIPHCARHPLDVALFIADHYDVGDRIGDRGQPGFRRNQGGDVVDAEHDAADRGVVRLVLCSDVAGVRAAVTRDEPQCHRSGLGTRGERSHLVEPGRGVLLVRGDHRTQVHVLAREPRRSQRPRHQAGISSLTSDCSWISSSVVARRRCLASGS